MSQPSQLSKTNQLREFSDLELAQILMERLSISPNDWHRLKSNRNSRAGEQIAAAMVFLLNSQPQEALVRLEQAVGWLNRSVSAPPCPTHGDRGMVSQRGLGGFPHEQLALAQAVATQERHPEGETGD